MALAFHCPTCRAALPVTPVMLGQKVTCQSCQANFTLSPAHLQGPANEAPASGAMKAAASASGAYPPASAAASSATMAAPRPAAALPAAAQGTGVPAAVGGSSPAQRPGAPLASAAAGAATVIVPAGTSLRPQADGKLPSLALATDGPARETKSSSQGGPSSLVLMATLALSVTLSLAMLLFDAGPAKSPESQVREARIALQRYFGDEENLLPYQKLLRESQRAHSRGDLKAERKCYRRVLELLRSEARSPRRTLTGTTLDDAKLEELLAKLMRETGP